MKTRGFCSQKSAAGTPVFQIWILRRRKAFETEVILSTSRVFLSRSPAKNLARRIVCMYIVQYIQERHTYAASYYIHKYLTNQAPTELEIF